MKHIVAGIDSSPSAFDVMGAAVDMVTATDARISLVRVVEGAGELHGLREALVSAARADLDAFARQVPASHLEGLLPTIGTAWHELCGAATTCDADLVAIGARRYGPFERMLGTTAAKVVNHCDRSVLVVRAWRRPPRRVLVALDDSERAAMVREYAVELARRTGGKLRLFRVLDLPAVVPADMLPQYPTLDDALRVAADDALGPIERLVPPELRDGVSAGDGATAWSPICKAAQEYDADLVMIGAHRYAFADRLLGTTAANVVNIADRSVLVVKRAWPRD